MVSRSKVVTLAVCASALVALIGLAALASAGKRLTEESESVTVASGEQGTATASCPRKKKAVSGGFEIEDFDPDAPLLNPIGSLRDGRLDWRSSAANSGSAPGEFTSYAYCRRQKVRSKLIDQTVPGVGMTFPIGTATVKCKRGYRVLSGGFDNPGFDPTPPDSSGLIPHESRKEGGRKWTTSALSFGAEPATQRVNVNCHKGKKLKTHETTVELDTSGGDPVTREVTAECGGKQRVVSGGFSTDTLLSSDGIQFVYSSKRLDKRTWAVSAAEFDGETNVTAYAYCEKKKKK